MKNDPRRIASIGPSSPAFKALRALAQEEAEFARELERLARGKARGTDSTRLNVN